MSDIVVGTIVSVVMCAGFIWLIVWLTMFFGGIDDGRKVYASSTPDDIPALKVALAKIESCRKDNLASGYFSLARIEADKVKGIRRAIAKHERTLARRTVAHWWNTSPAPTTSPSDDGNRTEWPSLVKK